jgi:hypothetical protein
MVVAGRRLLAVVGAALVLAFAAACGAPGIDRPPDRCELPKAPGPVDEEGESAGRSLGWQEIATDDFDQGCLAWYWNVYDGPGTYGVGTRLPQAVQVADGELRLLGQGGTIGGIAEVENRLYGRWEVRARSERRLGYSQVLLLWPESDRWPVDGEVDFSEVVQADRERTEITVHHGPTTARSGRAWPGTSRSGTSSASTGRPTGSSSTSTARRCSARRTRRRSRARRCTCACSRTSGR